MQFIGNLARVISYTCEVAELGNSIERFARETNPRRGFIRFCDTGVKLAGIICRTFCSLGHLGGAKPQTLQSIKQVEKGARIGEIATAILLAPKNSRQQALSANANNLFFRSMAIFEMVGKPLASYDRVNAEIQAYRTQASLPSATNGTSQPLSAHIDTSSQSWANVTRNVCLETLFQTGIFSRIASYYTGPDPVANDHNFRGFVISLENQHPRNEEPAPLIPIVEALPIDALDLLGASSIPVALHNDVVFSANICPISQEPIRHPVGDPNGITIYERDSILHALQVQQRSPVTGRPLTPDQLIPRPDLQEAIDRRLRMYQEAFLAFIAAHQNELNQAR